MEVFPSAASADTTADSLLHVRGGVSTVGGGARLDCQSSPRPWRCFQAPKRPNRAAGVFSTSVEVFPGSGRRKRCRTAVFSTSVEVFPPAAPESHSQESLLHVRGGVSAVVYPRSSGGSSSPRPWRCFFAYRRRLSGAVVFSTSVEVFLLTSVPIHVLSRLLHVRGGVSCTSSTQRLCKKSSPRPWRCFLTREEMVEYIDVFSTSVEVFLQNASL